MVMIIFGDDDDGGHEDKVGGAGCDMVTETDDADNIDDSFKDHDDGLHFILWFGGKAESSRLLHFDS
jgi:hypothetical protein